MNLIPVTLKSPGEPIGFGLTQELRIVLIFVIIRLNHAQE